MQEAEGIAGGQGTAGGEGGTDARFVERFVGLGGDAGEVAGEGVFEAGEKAEVEGLPVQAVQMGEMCRELQEVRIEMGRVEQWLGGDVLDDDEGDGQERGCFVEMDGCGDGQTGSMEGLRELKLVAGDVRIGEAVGCAMLADDDGLERAVGLLVFEGGEAG